MSIADNVALIRERMHKAAQRAGRKPDEITLMAVTKTVSPDSIREAYDAGIRVFGENRVQEFAGKASELRDLPDAEWHMIGHLQSNKAKMAVDLFGCVESVDSVKLAQKLNDAAQQLGKKIAALIEVNVAGEEAKSGVALDSPELEALLNAAPNLPALRFSGLMAIPPFSDNPETSRPHFRQLRKLFDKIAGLSYANVDMRILSMGMSHDFEIAIEEGATCIRVGTAIFGERKPLRGTV